MEISLLRTFLEIANSRSFGAAADKLFVTQSAVSLRIKKLEDELGQTLFSRSKAGVEMTPAGIEFERYAISLLKLREDARQVVSIPKGFKHTLSIGAQYSLWPRLGFRWLDDLQSRVPELSIRAELGMHDRLTRFLIEGIIQCALMYTPVLRPGLSATEILNEEMILVSTSPDNNLHSLKDRFIFVDWGDEFRHFHTAKVPMLENSGITLALGALSADYVLRRKAAAYLPARYVRDLIDTEELFVVADAPHFPSPIYAVWNNDVDPIIRAAGEASLMRIARNIDEKQEILLRNFDLPEAQM